MAQAQMAEQQVQVPFVCVCVCISQSSLLQVAFKAAHLARVESRGDVIISLMKSGCETVLVDFGRSSSKRFWLC